MAKEPADRPADPAEVARTLEPFCAGADLAALARAAPAPTAGRRGAGRP